MPNPATPPIVAAVTAAADFIQADYDARSQFPGHSPAAVEMRAAGSAIANLLEAVRHEGTTRAIGAGCMATDWRDHVTPLLLTAYDRAFRPVGAASPAHASSGQREAEKGAKR